MIQCQAFAANLILKLYHCDDIVLIHSHLISHVFIKPISANKANKTKRKTADNGN